MQSSHAASRRPTVADHGAAMSPDRRASAVPSRARCIHAGSCDLRRRIVRLMADRRRGDGRPRNRARVRATAPRHDPRARRDTDAGVGRRRVLRGSGAVRRRSGTRTRSSPALRNLLRDRAPDVLAELLAAGATEIPFTATLPPTLTDQIAAARRRRSRRARVPAHDVRVGAAPRRARAAGRRAPRRRRRRRPRRRSPVRRRASTGVAGLDADLVVDARGPRSSSDAWLAAIGAAPVPEELHESGIVYFSRFYRLPAPTPSAAGRRTRPRPTSAT